VATDALLLELLEIRAFVSLTISNRFGRIAGGFGERNSVRCVFRLPVALILVKVSSCCDSHAIFLRLFISPY
jgi:hypothetical protein